LMLTHKPPKKIVYSGFAFYTIFLIFLLKNQNFYLIISMLGILLWLIMYLLSSMNKKSFRRYFIYIFSGMIVAISSFLFMRVHHQSFSNYLLLNAVKISSERDLILENHLNELQTEISADRFLVNYANSFDTSMQWLTHIKNHYLSSFQDQYDIIGFICSSHDKFLNNNLEINCWQYYDSIVEYSQAQHISDNLYFITNANITYYLYKIMLHSELPHQLYLELYKKKPFRPEGYLELLVNIEEEQLLPGQLDYATYYNNTLMQSYGNTIFPLQVDNEIDAAPIGKLFKYHDKYAIKSEIDNNRFIVLVSNHTLPNWLSIFSFFIIIILLLYLIYYILIKGINIKKIFRSYAGRLQITLISIITIVILVAGILSVKYIQNTYSRQLEKQCFERNYGLYLSLQDEIVKNNIKINSTSIDSLLWKYKYSYFSDLHFYNTDGTLLSTTQFALFNDHLLTTLINPDVYWTNKWKKYWYYSNKEKISEFEYRNTYMPVFRGNNIIGILSIPMFSQITELRGELSELIGAFINIYAILLLISLIFTFLITQYINRPLQLISKRLKSLNLSKQNEKIEYKSNDEIGQLVKQYNQMIDELAEKAEKLAQNEREIAWREMAKQVAHEIKNPLTPMKLSVQFLQRIWKQDKKRFEQDIEKYLTTLLEQIEQLSEIATAFSQFNKMPEPLSKEVNLITLLQNLAALFHSTDYDINIHLESDKLTVIGDESRLNRAFTNILQNAVQALSNERRGEINIYAKSDNNNAIIIISDNGIGIANEMLENIFEPNFTTKSSGTGLGLAIVKHIIEDLNGKILVESLLGEGTKFTIILPLCY
jgi:two-component system nitrogen regulation sensor histidine kinase NtrY